MELIIFDMDGLMFDTESLGIQGWKHAFECFNLPVPMSTLIKKLGLSPYDSQKLFKEEVPFDFDYDKLKKTKIQYVFDHIDECGISKKKGLDEIINYLEKKQIKKIIATSSSQKVANFYLEKAGLKENFDAIITGDMVSRGKPNPDIFIKGSELLKINPSNCIVLEDSINGIKAAYNAKMKPIMIPDLVKDTSEVDNIIFSKCNDLLEVIDILENNKR